MDGSTPQAPSPTPRNAQICEDIGRAVGALWQRRSGVRPTNVATEYVGDVVRCTIDEGAEEHTDAQAELIGERRYENEAQAAVSRLTGRHVMGFTHKRVKDSGSVGNSFILARHQVRY